MKNLTYFGNCKSTTVENLKAGMYQVRNYGGLVKVLEVKPVSAKTSQVTFEGGQVLNLRNSKSIVAGWMDEAGSVKFEGK
jgi:hypothetical protein